MNKRVLDVAIRRARRRVKAFHVERNSLARRMHTINPFAVLNQLEESWNAALETAALIVCPEPQAEEERECADVARLIRAHKYPSPTRRRRHKQEKNDAH